MRLVVTTIVRDASVQDHGYVYLVDWESKKVVSRFQPPVVLPDRMIPRGGSRGFKGVTFLGDTCYIAYFNCILAYDRQWNLIDTISHPLFASLHEIDSDGEHLWVTSTGIDAVLKMTPDGEIVEEHFLGELPEEARLQLGITPRYVDRDGDYRDVVEHINTHVAQANAISVLDGRPYVTLYKSGAIIALNPFEVIWRDMDYYGLHSGRVLNGGKLLYVAGSFQSEFIGFDLTAGERTFRVNVLGDANYESSWMARIRKTLHHPAFSQAPTVFILKHAPPVVRRLLPTSRPGWTRGIAIVDEDHFFGGSSSATISLINSKEGRIEDQLQMEQGAQHSIFAIAVDKRDS